MIKKIIFVLVSLWWIGRVEVRASGFNLQAIGNVSTNGQQISQWWYTGLQPIFRGEALPGTEVTITIDQTSRQINADSSGNWNFIPETALAAGDHQVTITNQESTISFVLTLGSDQVDWTAVNQDTNESLPTVGMVTPTIALMSLGGGLMIKWANGKRKN